ncbi:tripartite tricarboxylate transporter substrate binding protein [Roseomonas sp. KE0001]|uniref:Bug family tripartite tricarboxylate transporter substrate binding protein n=1 Tax=Roseomonas sp. KE0001 TaxID=2479201 RepID=UPI0018DF7686|nr:tripartite tricarboxylate transporter substrate binding protein [Roseomonas sp. KE0001]MBI0433800.1 tripartite tricarboxylate transporter substrate binding protein [Roseomonas sp. KE0001]
MLRRDLTGLLAATPLLSLPALSAARAQAAWPNRPLTILVPFVAGGPSDIVARAIANRMSQTIGQPVVVENRAGANGEIAGRLLARAEPDGHTLLCGSIGVFAINAALRPDLGYDPVKEFAPVTLAVTTPNVLVVNPEKVPAKTVAELVAWLKTQRASYSTSGVGSSDQMTTELFKQRMGVDVAHVPYRGGAAAATDLIAGNVQMSFQNLGTVAGHIQGGRLRALMVTDARRHPILPDVPSSAEAGLQDFVVTSWQAVMAPAGLPAPVQERLHAAMAEALNHPEVKPRLEQIGFTVVGSTPAEFRRFQEAEIARWREVIQTAGIKPE